MKADLEHSGAPCSLNKATDLLRKFGMFGIGLGAVLFMLQGIHDIDQAWRHWTWVILLGGMMAAGLISRFLLDDVKSGRIFMLLAVCVIPVQFSQLGGQWWHLGSPEASATVTFWAIEAMSLARTLTETALCLGLSVAIAFTGFALLDREKALPLAGVFVGLCALMLLPWRTGFEALLVNVTAFLIVGYCFKPNAGLKLPASHRAILQAIVCLPVGIMTVRNSMHMDPSLCWALLAWMFGPAILLVMRRWSENAIWREVCLFLGGLCLGLGVVLLLDFGNVDPTLWTVIGPFAGMCLLLNHGSLRLAGTYRAVGSLGLCAVIFFTLVSSVNWEGAASALATGALLTVYGLFFQWRWPLLSGLLASAMGVGSLIWLSVHRIDVNLWVSLAVSGVALLLLSSFIEKYGRQWLARLQAIRDFS